MKLSFNQKLSLVYLILGIIILPLLAQPIGIPKAYAASKTAWQITDLDNASITTTRSMFFNGWLFTFKDANNTETYGDIWDSANSYNDGNTTATAQNFRIDISSGMEFPNIVAGDTLTVTGDGTPSNLTIYLPAVNTNTTLYVADDGSTYYDSNLTNLAYGAPVAIDIALDSNSAYNFSSTYGSLVPEQTYTSPDNIRNVTVTCNSSFGWKLYVKSTGNFTSGANTINVNYLEWKWNDEESVWTDMSTTDIEVRSSNNPTSASGVTTGMEYRINVPYGNVPASNYSATITYTAIAQ